MSLEFLYNFPAKKSLRAAEASIVIVYSWA